MHVVMNALKPVFLQYAQMCMGAAVQKAGMLSVACCLFGGVAAYTSTHERPGAQCMLTHL